MINFFQKLFHKNEEVELEEEEVEEGLERKVEKFLLELPVCTRKVVVVSPMYDSKCYKCEVIADAKLFQPWAKRHAQGLWSTDRNDNIARETLPLWLLNADLTNDEHTYLHEYIYDVIELYVSNLIDDKIAEIFCFECDSIVPNVFIRGPEEERFGGSPFFGAYQTTWHCRSGHLLYGEEAHTVHF